jgi:hypothetical protein
MLPGIIHSRIEGSYIAREGEREKEEITINTFGRDGDRRLYTIRHRIEFSGWMGIPMRE